MLLTPVIPRTTNDDPALDQRQLYAQGLDGIRRLSRKLWTDHNTHDPGITTLELACYALTELAYRAGFAVEDLLATADDNAGTMAQQFFTPRQILPNRPVTTRDYRKLLIDLDGVKNAWVQPAARRIYADTIKAKLMAEDSGQPGVRAIDIQGLYSVLVEYMDDVTTKAQKQDIDKTIRTALNANRNLCEVFTTIGEVGQQFYALCAELEIEPAADQVEVAAQIRFQVQRYLAPPVHCHSLATMLARTHADGSPYTVPEIFEGPALSHGFIDDADLDAAELRREIRLSDVISIIMDIPGVRAVRDIVVNALVLDKGVWEAVEAPDKWRQQVPEGVQPRLSEEVGRLVFYKRNVPVVADPDKVADRIEALEAEEKASLETVNEEDLPIPLGKARDTAHYHSFQHHFPVIYGLSAQGLSTSDPQRKALALQLKGYLLFFDQLMANFFAQLAQLRKLYARNYASAYGSDPEAARTYFAQRVDNIPDFAKVYGAGTDAAKLQALLEDADAALLRRNRILDHLLARLGEEFHDYVAIMQSAFGNPGGQQMAADALAKANFIADYPKLGAERSLAYNYTLQDAADLWNSYNVSGLERRLCRLLDIANFSRRNLGTVSYDTYTEIDSTPGDEYRFRVKHPVTNKILLSSSTNYATPEQARAEMENAITLAQQPGAYQRKTAVDGKHYFNIVDDSNVVARRIEYFSTEDEMEAAISLLIAHLREYYSGEGMYLIENILLLPEEKDDPFLDICTDPACTDCSDDDPYSYRLHFILPAYAGRFQNMDFRRFVEETIRQETPAHILPKVCWIDSDDMAMLEGPYRDWVSLRAGVTSADRKAKIQALIDALQHVKNVYPSRSLHDCGSDESKPPFILGQSALGSEKPDLPKE